MALLNISGAGLRPLPLGLLSQALPMLSRSELEDVIERLIDELDRRDGDSDLEDGCDSEDDWTLSPLALRFADRSPGCPISDPGGQADEDGINTGTFVFGLLGHGPGCPISDPGEANR